MMRPTSEFDHHAPEFAEDRHGCIAALRAKGPLVWTDANAGHWISTSYELSKTILTDPVTFSSLKRPDGSGGVTIPSMGPVLIPAELDPPDHTAIRRILNPIFSKSGVEKVREHVEGVVDAALDAAMAKGEFDVADDIAWNVAPLTIIEWLGLPTEGRTEFIDAVRQGLSCESLSDDAEDMVEAFARTVETITELIDDRRANPGEDLASLLVNHPDSTMSDEDLIWLIFTLLLGGIENTAALITNSLLHLAENPDLRDRLRADPSLIPRATEELLRYFSPGVSLARNVTKDVELGGVTMRAGERVLVLVPAGNLDPETFAGPDVVDLDRPPGQNLSFGLGPHFCVGIWLARLEFHYLLEQILIRMPEYSVDRSGGVRYHDAGTMNGWSRLPARVNSLAGSVLA